MALARVGMPWISSARATTETAAGTESNSSGCLVVVTTMGWGGGGETGLGGGTAGPMAAAGSMRQAVSLTCLATKPLPDRSCESASPTE